MLTGVTDVQLLGPKPLRSHFQAVQQLRGRLPWYASPRTASESHCVLKMGSDDCNIPAALIALCTAEAPPCVGTLLFTILLLPVASTRFAPRLGPQRRPIIQL